ncbi:carboxymuconolactone decarboxylase family protein [uncultured Methanobrevibacter sp.]|uniref:carboxymuconolactone decarboxylase family protein n=1 Tax=uncultured Methanobrevibacter sp. TaxID=253161 RepID=UPI0025CF5950|nr:carboxymuconolactone decarboxylase family protein [uncultured Methanobrevibacter sp.]
MSEKVFYGKGVRRIKEEDPELYESIEDLDKNIWNSKVLDYRTQKLIAIAISATSPESSSFLKQVSKAKKELNITKDEMMDVLKVVLLTSGMMSFNKALQIVNKLYD